MFRPLLLAGLIGLAACSSEPAPSASPSATASVPAEPSATPTPSTSATAAPSPTNAAPTVADLGLTVGVYAAAGSSCPPPMAGLATFDGKGFGSRNATACTFAPTERDGQSFRGKQTCTDPASGERVTEDLTITVASPRRFTRGDRWGTATFNLCPDEKLTDWTG